MIKGSFDQDFEALTDYRPFPWQKTLYDQWFTHGKIPASCNLPTGLGKTNVIAVWLIARANGADVPRRLIYVVNRRTVVDQTTNEAINLRKNAVKIGIDNLAISTLRGQFADNQDWSADPMRPAVICGTVDMIGSRLLFTGYRIGFKSRPLHAGFLGQDALLVHDEAHLEPAFQKLIETIQDEQKQERGRNGDLPWPGLCVMALSATARGNDKNVKTENHEPFGLTDEENQPPDDISDAPTEPIHHVWRRLKAKKSLRLRAIDDEKKLAERVAELALTHKDSNASVLVFVRTIDDVNKVCDKLTDKKDGGPAEQARQLTGTMRGYERDNLVEDATFQRFLHPSKDADRTVYLVCTSAGEVGVNLSADHMVCDLSTFDSMAQRLGRVNRFGDPLEHVAQVDVVYPAGFDENNASGTVEEHRLQTLKHLRRLPSLGENQFDASPKALGDVMRSLTDEERKATFAPMPIILPATDILFDTWALTTIRGKIPGRPPVAAYLHGVAEWEAPRTSVAWRQEVEVITDELIQRQGEDLPQELLADYPLKPHELLRDRTDRVLKALQKLAVEHANSPVWLIDDQQQVRVSTLGKIANPAATRAQDKSPLEKAIAEGIVLLPPSVGGLSTGLLNADSEQADDIADHWIDQQNRARRHREFNDNPRPTNGPQGMALVCTIDTDPLADETASPNEESKVSTKNRFWHWYARPRDAEDATLASPEPIVWGHHTRDVVDKTKQIVDESKLPDQFKQAVILAAELHDLGKQREIWQRSIGNPNSTDWYAKPGKPKGAPRWRPCHLSDYRHEFGSLLDVLHADVEHAGKFAGLSDGMRDVVLHLIAAHHGYARPHFPPDAYDHERYNTQQNADAAHEVMCRYARLQRRFGRWGLAYLESLLRAADWDASANPSDNTSHAGGAS